jgi:hypothetical protein
MRMNETRREKEGNLYASLAAKGHSQNSSACMIGEVDIEEDCIAELLHQKADLYVDAYQRNGMKIGPDVLQDISLSHVGLVATRKSTLMAEAELTARRTRSTGMNLFSAVSKPVLPEA